MMNAYVAQYIGTKRVAALARFYREVLKVNFDLYPHWQGHDTAEFGIRTAVVSVNLFDPGQPSYCIGHLSVSILEDGTLHIISLGREHQNDLERRDGRLTGVMRAMLGQLQVAGLKKVRLRDVSNGYWAHFQAKYFPGLEWERMED